MTYSSLVEVLESRIAPAVLFLTQDFILKNAANHVVAPDTADANLAGATAAFALKTGDSIVLDLNGNHRLDKGEIVLAKITGGRAVLFLNDLNGDSKFDIANEITGLAVSNSFRGSVNAAINGSVVTALDKTGTFQSTAIQDAAILSLTVAGPVGGDIVAGRSISSLAIGSSESSGLSVAQILSGTGASQDVVSYNGGATTFTLDDFSPTDGTAGGSITNVKLVKGVSSIIAGDGAAGFAGGDIKNLVIALQGTNDLILSAGNGAASETGLGGNGGEIASVTIGAMNGALKITAGDAGAGGSTDTSAGAGGHGGSITGVNATFAGSTGVSLGAGAGAEAGSFDVAAIYNSNGDIVKQSVTKGGAGGAGGSVTGVTLNVLGNLDSLAITAGQGGDGHGSKPGGVGGDVSQITQTGGGASGDVAIDAGDAGHTANDGNGTNGGNIKNISLPNTTGTLSIHAGNGADGQNAGAGGAGGSITKLNAVIAAATGVNISAGSGGASGSFDVDPVTNASGDEIKAGYTSGGAGGDGGSISNLTLAVTGDGTTPVSIAAGDGGTGSGKSGGNGGGINIASVSVDAIDHVSIQSGAGAAGGTNGGMSGNGGNIVSLTFISTANIAGDSQISAGNGGNTAAASDGTTSDSALSGGDTTGGNGGSISKLTLQTQAPQLDVVAGIGGAGSGTKDGANGGSINGVQGTADAVSFVSGAGGGADTSSDAGGAGGDGGGVTNLQLSANALVIATGAGGDSAGAFAGGMGGAIAHVKAGIGAGEVSFTTGGGGAGGHLDIAAIYNSSGDRIIKAAISKGAAGGNGGAISDATLNSLGDAKQTFNFTTGNGGSATLGKAAGDGGAVTGVRVNVMHQIQDFAIHTGAGGDGDANDDGSIGGFGGAIAKINLTVSETIDGIAELIAGNGGAGNLKAGIGGSIATASLNAANDFNNNVQAGAGGDDDVAHDGKIFADVTVNGSPVLPPAS